MGFYSLRCRWPGDDAVRQKMVDEQGNDREQHPEENYTGTDVDTEEDDGCITDYICIHR